jgi:hypothetical protein
MVVTDFDVVGVAVHETKTDPPLFVDRNRMLTFSITSQAMQPVARWDLEIAEISRSIDLLELSPSSCQNLRG